MTILLIYVFYLIIGILPSVDYYNKNHIVSVENTFKSRIFRLIVGSLISFGIMNVWVYHWLKGDCTFKPEAEGFYCIIVTTDVKYVTISKTIKVFFCLSSEELPDFNLVEYMPGIFNNPDIQATNISFDPVCKRTYEKNMVEYLKTLN